MQFFLALSTLLGTVYIFRLDAVQKTKKIEDNVNELSSSLGKRSFFDIIDDCFKTWWAEPPLGGSALRARKYLSVINIYR